MEIELNKDVMFVSGLTNGAIYNFNNGKVYHINSSACEIILDYFHGKINIENNEYLQDLANNCLISVNFVPRETKITKKHFNRKLEMAWLELTEACNLKCIHCYEGNCHKRKNNPLTLDEWKDIIFQLVNLKIKRVILIGGEPTCYKGVEEIVDFCGKNNLNITYFTNATMLNDQLIDLFSKYNVQVKISIYGFDKTSHDSITTVSGSFDKTLNNIIKLRDKNIKTYASVIMMKENQDYLQNIISFLKKYSVIYTGYDVVRQVYGQNQNIHCPTNNKIIQNRFMSKPNFKADKTRFIMNHFANSCWYGKIAINEDGKVIPCVFHRDDIVGNARENTIVEIINSFKTKKYWDLDFSNVEQCSCCEYRFACKDCRVVAYGNNGNIFEKNPRCRYNPKTGVWAK